MIPSFSSSNLLSPAYGILAQVVEHLTFNQVVGGSNPPCLNKQKRYCNAVPFLFILKGGFEKEAAEHAEQKRWHAKAKMIALDHFSDVARESPVSQ